MATKNLPGAIPAPALPSRELFVVVFEVIICQQNDIHSIELIMWDGETQIDSYTFSVENFPHHMEMTAAYLMTMVDRLDRSYVRNSDDKLYLATKSVIEFLGNTVWQFLQPDDRSKKLWEYFIRYVAEHSNRQVIIVVCGDGVTTWPVETLANVLERRSGHRMGVVKTLAPTSYVRKLLSNRLPSTLVLVYGDPHIRGANAGANRLDHVTELTRVLETFFPDGLKETRDEISFAVQSGHEFRTDAVHGIVVGQQGPSVDHLREVLSLITEPYILVYSGHGYRNRYWVDGTISIQASSSGAPSSHDEFAKALDINPPEVVIFNCCDSIRVLEPQSSSVSHGDGTEMEFIYQEIHSVIGGIKMVCGNRTKILDGHGIAVAESLAGPISNSMSFADLVVSLGSASSSSSPATLKGKAMAMRDAVAGTIVALSHEEG